MTGARTLCVVHNNVNDASSIGKLAAWAVRTGLEAGYEVSVVARDLAPELRPHVEHLPLYVPPRIHVAQWAAARATVRRAIGRRQFDVLHVYQPQIAALADTWHVEFLSRAARQASAREPNASSRVRGLQAEVVAQMEDRYIRRLPDRTRLLFCSEGLCASFERIYGRHSNATVLHNPALDIHTLRQPSANSRRRLTGAHTGPVVGFLGGGDPRKGGDVLLRAVAAEEDLFLLAAGPGIERLDGTGLGTRFKALGMLTKLDDFFASIDVLVVPSVFEPFGMVVTEAAARGVATLAAPGVGSLPLLERYGAGAAWSAGEPLGAALKPFVEKRDLIEDRCRRLVRALSPDFLSMTLANEWRERPSDP